MGKRSVQQYDGDQTKTIKLHKSVIIVKDAKAKAFQDQKNKLNQKERELNSQIKTLEADLKMVE